jgi:hypothetical protein
LKSLEKRWIVSEEQMSQQPANASPLAGSLNGGNARAKGTKVSSARARTAKEPLPSESLRSMWPLILAVTLMIMFLGLMIHPIVFAIGAVLAAGSVIGWALERR